MALSESVCRVGEDDAVGELFGDAEKRCDFGEGQVLLLAILDLIGDLTAVMCLVDAVDARGIAWQFVSLTNRKRDVADDPVLDTLGDWLRGKVSLDEDFKDVAAIFFLGHLIDPILEDVEGLRSRQRCPV